MKLREEDLIVAQFVGSWVQALVRACVPELRDVRDENTYETVEFSSVKVKKGRGQRRNRRNK